ncbi:hypothetical protein [Nocardia alni]|uniref:hypothetical protein n=1 Tax=Nocardia alni TaxID=2815723 RepID=UPI001C243A55|nr:hypothetical protein [Nocardia alni]
MTDLTFETQEMAGTGHSIESTPLHRAARQLQEALPSGWGVDVVDVEVAASPRRPGQTAAILRVRTPDN